MTNCPHRSGLTIALSPEGSRSAWCSACSRTFHEKRGEFEVLKNQDCIVRLRNASFSSNGCTHAHLRVFRYTGQVRCYTCAAICGDIVPKPFGEKLLFVELKEPKLVGLPG